VCERGCFDLRTWFEMRAADVRGAATFGERYEAHAVRVEGVQGVGGAAGEVDDVHVFFLLLQSLHPMAVGGRNCITLMQPAESSLRLADKKPVMHRVIHRSGG
jgi:hypothetical protein